MMIPAGAASQIFCGGTEITEGTFEDNGVSEDTQVSVVVNVDAVGGDSTRSPPRDEPPRLAGGDDGGDLGVDEEAGDGGGRRHREELEPA